jgi:hypothetical protein
VRLGGIISGGCAHIFRSGGAGLFWRWGLWAKRVLLFFSFSAYFLWAGQGESWFCRGGGVGILWEGDTGIHLLDVAPDRIHRLECLAKITPA